MPSPLRVVQRLDALAGPFADVRLPGDRGAVHALTPTLNHFVLDRGDQVASDTEAFRLLRRRGRSRGEHVVDQGLRDEKREPRSD
jgi:hypothetical protein